MQLMSVVGSLTDRLELDYRCKHHIRIEFDLLVHADMVLFVPFDQLSFELFGGYFYLFQLLPRDAIDIGSIGYGFVDQCFAIFQESEYLRSGEVFAVFFERDGFYMQELFVSGFVRYQPDHQSGEGLDEKPKQDARTCIIDDRQDGVAESRLVFES